jgi:deoxyribonuclease V
MGADVHRWPGSAEELERLQVELAELAMSAPAWTPPEGRPLRCAGLFVTFGAGPPGRERAWAAATVLEDHRELARAAVHGRAGGPYSPGHLAMQRGPLLEAAVRGLDPTPDVILVNATGCDHPRRAGLALHLGAVLDIPTVGVTDRPLLARGGEPGPSRGDTAPLTLGDELVGSVLRTRRRVRPVLVHASWRTTPQSAREVVLACTGRARTPEPLRLARSLARLLRAGDEGRLSGPPRAEAAAVHPR